MTLKGCQSLSGICIRLLHLSASDLNTDSQNVGETDSIPYLWETAVSFSMSLYGTSAGGGSVITGAGTLHSLKYPSSPAGVSRMSIRSCSEWISNECSTFRGRKTRVPGVPLIVRLPTEAVISPSRM